MLGGAGGLATEVPAKFYRRCPAMVPLQDILQAGGEKLSIQADQSLPNQQLVACTLLKQKAGEALRTLAGALGAGVAGASRHRGPLLQPSGLDTPARSN